VCALVRFHEKSHEICSLLLVYLHYSPTVQKKYSKITQPLDELRCIAAAMARHKQHQVTRKSPADFRQLPEIFGGILVKRGAGAFEIDLQGRLGWNSPSGLVHSNFKSTCTTSQLFFFQIATISIYNCKVVHPSLLHWNPHFL